jgi:hypothetical protein
MTGEETLMLTVICSKQLRRLRVSEKTAPFEAQMYRLIGKMVLCVKTHNTEHFFFRNTKHTPGNT